MRKKNYRVRPSRIKRSMGERILFSVVFIIFAILALSYVFAFLWIFLNSMKDSFEFAIGEALDMPEKLLWGNYLQAFREFNVEGSTFLDMWWNTIWLAVGRTFLTLLSTSMCAYAYARYEFRFRKLLYVFSVIMMTLQIPSGGAAAYKLYTDWGLTNTPLFLIGATVGLGSTFIIFVGFYRGISWEYAEAAFVDGCTDFGTWRHIMLPQVMPLIGTQFIMGVINGLQDYTTSMLYMTDYPTVAYGLYEYEASCIRAMNYPVYYAGLIIVAIPGVIIFVALMDQIMASLNIGGLKG